MKDKRNCGNNLNYPVYQQPMMMPPMGYPIGNPGGFFQGYPNQSIAGSITTNTFEQQINNIEQQINLLEHSILG